MKNHLKVLTKLFLFSSGGQADTDDHNNAPTVTAVAATSGTSASNKYSRSQSESSSQSQVDNGTSYTRSKHFPISSRKQQKSNIIQSKISSNQTRSKVKTTDVIDYFENNTNDQWGDWEEPMKQSSDFLTTNTRYQQSYSNDRRRQQQTMSTDGLPQKSNRYNEHMNDNNRTKQSSKTRSTGKFFC